MTMTTVLQVGRIGDASSVLHGNVLQQYAKCCVSLGVDRPIMRCLLRHGAEPEVKVKVSDQHLMFDPRIYIRH